MLPWCHSHVHSLHRTCTSAHRRLVVQVSEHELNAAEALTYDMETSRQVCAHVHAQLPKYLTTTASMTCTDPDLSAMHHASPKHYCVILRPSRLLQCHAATGCATVPGAGASCPALVGPHGGGAAERVAACGLPEHGQGQPPEGHRGLGEAGHRGAPCVQPHLKPGVWRRWC